MSIKQLTVFVENKQGALVSITELLSENNINVLDISQTIMQDMFTMMMIVDIEKASSDMSKLSSVLENEGKNLGVDIRIQLESIFESMHRI